MWLKDMLKQDFSNEKVIIEERYKASKFAFVFSVLLFFLNFYFVWANFYSEVFKESLGITYTLMLLSLVLYIYILIRKIYLEKIPKMLNAVIFMFLILFFAVLLFPFVFK